MADVPHFVRPTVTCWAHPWPQDCGKNVSAYVTLDRSTRIVCCITQIIYMTGHSCSKAKHYGA